MTTLEQYLIGADLILFIIMCAQFKRMNELSRKLRKVTIQRPEEV